MKLTQVRAKWFSLALLMGAVAFTGCSTDDNDTLPTTPTLALGVKSLDFTHTTETKSVEFESNYAWTALKPSNANWVRVTPDAGEATDGTINIQFLVDNNTQAVDRQAVIRFVHNKGNKQDSIVIKQSAFILHPEQYKDSLALVKFYNDCRGYQWAYNWDLDIPFDQWGGITTDLIGGQKRVVEIDLVNQGITGALPQQLTDLTELRKFVIYNANIGTTIPTWFNQFPRLTFLALAACELRGEVPEAIYGMTDLTRLDLLDNPGLVGSISPKIGQLVNLTIWDWRKCGFTGSIPTEIGNMTNLEEIYLLNNELTGSIPASIGNLSKLTTVILSANSLTGSIPTSIGNLTKLEVLDLTENNLSGSLPSELGNCKELWDFRGMVNQFSGAIPAEIGALPELTIFSMDNNQFTGEIPASFAASNTLVHLRLKGNKLTGSIDPRFSKLETLALSNNQLSGEIPQEIFLSYAIQDLELGGNPNLSAEVPAIFFERGNFLLVDFNGLKQVEGTLPSNMGDFFASHFDIGGCRFNGTIPSDIFLVKDLAYLDLSNNEFTGNIPSQANSATEMMTFKVNGNRLEGEIPSIIKTHRFWSNWNPTQFICPQEPGYGLTGC